MKINNILHISLIACFLLPFNSCENSQEFVKGGDSVAFYGGTQASIEETKAEYGGDTSRYAVGEKVYEKIFWSQGDIMRITCEQAQDSTWADYVVSQVQSDKTKATIVLNSATSPVGLRWNDNASLVHDFYSAYPSPTMGGVCTKQEYCKIVADLPQSQNTLANALKAEGTGYVLYPDMKWMLMYAYDSYSRTGFPVDGSVFLRYYPVTTAIRFEITNSVDKDLVIKELQLISADTQICGAFRVDNMAVKASDGFPAVVSGLSSVGDEHKVVKLAFSPSVTILKDETFTFTFFFTPVSDVQDLKFRIVRGAPDDGATLTTRLGKTDGTYLFFPRCKKSFVKGIMVPEGVQWVIDYEPQLTKWIDDGEQTITLK